MLKRLFQKAGSHPGQIDITSTGLQWHQGPTLFENCAAGRAPCHCEPLQQITRGRLITRKTETFAVELPEAGCVGFGQKHHSPICKQSTQSNAICIHENLPINVTKSPDNVEISSNSPCSTRPRDHNHQITGPLKKHNIASKSECESTASQANFAVVVHPRYKTVKTLQSGPQLQGDTQKSPSEQWLSLSRHVSSDSFQVY